MPSQLVYTSAPRGLVSGQSGFCVVARSADLREALSQRLERISSYHYLEVTTAGLPAAKASSAGPNPIISAYRVLDLRGAKYHVLTRIQPSGLDFTARTNHLAHHLVFLPEELAQLPAPAAILRDWDGWLATWQGEPRILEPLGPNAFARIPPPAWPAKNWMQVTGDAGRAAGLLEPEFARGCYLALPPGGEHQLLQLFCQTCQLSNADGKTPLRPWQYTFTTFLQAEDAVGDFQWRGCRPGSPAADLVSRRGVTLTDLCAIRVPDNPLAKLAREGPALPAEAVKGRVTLRKDDAPARTVPRPGLPDFEALSQGSTTRTRRPIGVYLTINTNVVRSLAVACVLVLLLLGILSKLHVFPFRSAAVVPTPTNNAVSSTPQLSQPVPPPPATSPVPETIATSTPTATRIPPPQQLEELNRFPDMPTYVVVASSFDPPPGLPLDGIAPLAQILESFHKINLKPDDLDLRFSHDLWELPSVMERLQVKSSPVERKLVAGTSGGGGVTHFVAQVTFDYSGRSEASGAAPPPRAEIVLPELTNSAKSLSLVFRPAQGASSNFEAFRLLFVNAASPPRPLSLHKDRLNLDARGVSAILSASLHKRLDWFQSAQWQLRPSAKSSADSDCQDLYAGWPSDEQPRSGEELSFATIAERLRAKRAGLAQQITNNAVEIQAALDGVNGKVDENLPIGAWLKLENNPELKSFAEYRRSQLPGNRSAASLLPDYLDQLKKQGEKQHGWVRDQWPNLRGKGELSVSDGLRTIYDLCKNNIEKKANALTLSGSTPNYFLALLANLRLEDHEAELERKQAALEAEVTRLDGQLARIPATLADSPCLSLSLLTRDSKPIEVIRFR
jgi:hypothetical protein